MVMQMSERKSERIGQGARGNRPWEVDQFNEDRGRSSDGWRHEADLLGSRAGRKLEQRNEEEDGMLRKKAG